MRRLIDPLAAYATGDVKVDASGNVMLDSSGNPYVESATNGCCVYQVRDCNTNTLQAAYVRQSQFPAYPATWYFSYGGGCYYAQASDKAACNSTPIITPTATFASCSACASAIGGYCGVYALVSFSGITVCSACPDPNLGNVTQAIAGVTFCLHCCNLGGSRTAYCFCDNTTTYEAVWSDPCGTTTTATCYGLTMNIGQTQCPPSGTDGFGDFCTANAWYWAFNSDWYFGCGGVLYPFFYRSAPYGSSAVPDLRAGGTPVAGDSYTFANQMTAADCAFGNQTWGYGGSATVTFASSCPGGAAVSNC